MTETMHPSDLALYHKNPRQGNVAAIAASLRSNGQMKPIVVNRGTHTGRPNEVLAGNHTVKAIRNLAEEYPDDDRWQKVLVHVVDVDDDRAARFVAADNRTSELGAFDDRLLLELLADLPDLDGTGYDPGDIEALEDLVNNAPSLDDLLEEVGEPTDEDKLQSLSLKVDGHTKRLWDEYRKEYSDDDGALLSLLEKLG
ncbi:ParB-like nuclease domain [Mycobacteroides abscessus subsp. abscessus]|nr:ParB-like nuclease domain [Mycobacteroides abscessus subsp. abscessus]